MATTALALISAHLIADFPLQTNWIAKNKLSSWKIRLIHVFIHYIVTFALIIPFLTVGKAHGIAFFISSVHFFIDTRRWAEEKEGLKSYPIIVDQTMHIFTLYLSSLLLL
jgi:hypothetical protein